MECCSLVILLWECGMGHFGREIWGKENGKVSASVVLLLIQINAIFWLLILCALRVLMSPILFPYLATCKWYLTSTLGMAHFDVT